MLGSTNPVLSTFFFQMLSSGVQGNLVSTWALQRWPLILTQKLRAVDSTNRPLYVRKGANSWTRFSVTLQLCFFMKTLAIVLVGGAAKIAADVIFGWLSLLGPSIYKAEGQHKQFIFTCPSTCTEASLTHRSERAIALRC